MSAKEGVEPLDMVEDDCPSVVTRAINFFPDPLGLQRGEKALHRRIVPDRVQRATEKNFAYPDLTFYWPNANGSAKVTEFTRGDRR
jgi:hypothetical protein